MPVCRPRRDRRAAAKRHIPYVTGQTLQGGPAYRPSCKARASLRGGHPAWKSSMVTASPCRNICQLDKTGRLCLGCGRTLDEIAGWAGMTDAQRREVMRRLESARLSSGDQLQPTQ